MTELYPIQLMQLLGLVFHNATQNRTSRSKGDIHTREIKKAAFSVGHRITNCEKRTSICLHVIWSKLRTSIRTCGNNIK